MSSAAAGEINLLRPPRVFLSPDKTKTKTKLGEKRKKVLLEL